MMKKSTSLLCGIAFAVPVAASAQLFVDGFDTAGSAAAWNVQTTSADTQIDFGWDYSALGIPAAPNGVGTTGVRMAANIANGAAAGLSMTPTGVVLPTNYTVTFDMWINANGPFPGGGNGSTEFVTTGVGNPSAVQWTGGSDGLLFGASGEGGSTIDFRAYQNGALQGVASGVYAAGTDTNARDNNHAYYHGTFPGGQMAPQSQQDNYPQQTGGLAVGTVGFGWREVEVRVTGGTAEWYVDNLLIGTASSWNTTGDVFIGYSDPFNSLSDNADLSFGVIDNFQIIPEPSTYALIAGLGILGLAMWRRSRKSVA